MKIVLDAMGGDKAPRETIRGAVMAVNEYGYNVVLVG
ncbi:MAG: phosphate--acyl-ACP acyltransferase, partial [Candidatus Omnitrophota bacterium]